MRRRDRSGRPSRHRPAPSRRAVASPSRTQRAGDRAETARRATGPRSRPRRAARARSAARGRSRRPAPTAAIHPRSRRRVRRGAATHVLRVVGSRALRQPVGDRVEQRQAVTTRAGWRGSSGATREAVRRQALALEHRAVLDRACGRRRRRSTARPRARRRRAPNARRPRPRAARSRPATARPPGSARRSREELEVVVVEVDERRRPSRPSAEHDAGVVGELVGVRAQREQVARRLDRREARARDAQRRARRRRRRSPRPSRSRAGRPPAWTCRPGRPSCG